MMQRSIKRLSSFVVMMLFATGLANASPALAFNADALHTSMQVDLAKADAGQFHVGLLPLQAKRFGDEGQTTEDKQFGLSHVFAFILLSIGLMIGLGWIFGWELVLRLRKDPLPTRVRSALNRLDSARTTVRSLALGAIARRQETELTEEKKLYDRIAEKADALIEKAKTDFCLNAIDEPLFVAEIEALIAQSKQLCARLGALQPTGGSAVDIEDKFKFGWASINRTNRGWERVFAKDKDLKITTITQLNDMRWPLWSTLK